MGHGRLGWVADVGNPKTVGSHHEMVYIYIYICIIYILLHSVKGSQKTRLTPLASIDEEFESNCSFVFVKLSHRLPAAKVHGHEFQWLII